jgi:hypothetical protein
MAQADKALPETNELEHALALHQAMSRLCSHGEDNPSSQELTTLLLLLKESTIPWPQRDDLNKAIESVQTGVLSQAEFMREGEFMKENALPAFIRDLGIWIVERYYRPSSLAEVKCLISEFQKAGLSHVLYACFEKERPYLTDREHLLLQRVFEDWINAVWDTDGDQLMAALEEDGVSTTGQFIAWLKKYSLLIIDLSVAPVIEELQQKAA